MGKFQVSPILNLIENLTENITLADVDMSIGQIMRGTNWGESLIDVGKSFITPESSPLGKNHLNWRLFTKIFFSSYDQSIFYVIWYSHNSNINLQ